MGKFEVKEIYNLLDYDLDRFVKESKEEGFRFVERLVTDYKAGSNTFGRCGEILLGVFTSEGVLVAVGGLNIDPFSHGQYIGRLRRFYVSKDFRKNGIRSLLVERIIDEAKRYYRILVLHTDTERADKFYTCAGFIKENLFPNSSHFMKF